MLSEQLRPRGLIFGDRAALHGGAPAVPHPEHYLLQRGCRDWPSLPRALRRRCETRRASAVPPHRLGREAPRDDPGFRCRSPLAVRCILHGRRRDLHLHRVQRRDSGGLGLQRRADRAFLACRDASVPPAVRRAATARRPSGRRCWSAVTSRRDARHSRASASSTGTRCRPGASSWSSRTTSRAGDQLCDRDAARARVPRE